MPANKQLEDSGDFAMEPRRYGSRPVLEHQVLLGQLLEAVKGLRREIWDLRKELGEQSETTGKLTERVQEFERMAQHGRGIMIGLGLASLGVGAGVSKIIEMLWPS